DPVHRPPPARHLRLQGRRDALVMARGLLLLQRARDRPVSAVHARRRPGLPGSVGRRVSAGALAWSCPGQVVAARAAAVFPTDLGGALLDSRRPRSGRPLFQGSPRITTSRSTSAIAAFPKRG